MMRRCAARSIAAVACVLVAATLVAGCAEESGTPASGSSGAHGGTPAQGLPPQESTVPDVIGMTLVEAQRAVVGEALFADREITDGPQDPRALGPEIVYAQDPEPGTVVSRGTTVTVYSWW